MGYVDCGRLPKKNSTYLVVGATVLWPIGSAAQENDPSSRARGRHGSQLRAPCVFQVADQRQHPDRERKRITQPLQHSFFSNNARRQHHARRSTCPTASRGPGPNCKRIQRHIDLISRTMPDPKGWSERDAPPALSTSHATHLPRGPGGRMMDDAGIESSLLDDWHLVHAL
jgi:hypothetical protein